MLLAAWTPPNTAVHRFTASRSPHDDLRGRPYFFLIHGNNNSSSLFQLDSSTGTLSVAGQLAGSLSGRPKGKHRQGSARPSSN